MYDFTIASSTAVLPVVGQSAGWDGAVGEMALAVTQPTEPLPAWGTEAPLPPPKPK